MNYIYHIPCECGEFARKRKNGEPYEKGFVMRCPYCKIKETVKPSLFRKGVVKDDITHMNYVGFAYVIKE